jgi:hypothetical protein
VEGATVARRARELRDLGAAKAAEHAAARAGGRADVVVIADGASRVGLTEDYLTVALADDSLPRGARFDAVLHASGTTLVAVRR